jgi:hypothetical protein
VRLEPISKILTPRQVGVNKVAPDKNVPTNSVGRNRAKQDSKAR